MRRLAVLCAIAAGLAGAMGTGAARADLAGVPVRCVPPPGVVLTQPATPGDGPDLDGIAPLSGTDTGGDGPDLD